MGQEKKEPLNIAVMARDLCTFAIDRTDLKELLAAVHPDAGLNMTAVEYELQLLKILSVGWALSFFMPADDKDKAPLAQTFWENVRDISHNISTLAQNASGTSIDYFEILKQRLNLYLKALQDNPEKSSNPAEVIGPVFARTCGNANHPAAILTGTKMFALTLSAVKEYLNAIRIGDIRLN